MIYTVFATIQYVECTLKDNRSVTTKFMIVIGVKCLLFYLF